MRRAMLLLLCLALMPCAAYGNATWAPSGQGAKVQSSGDILAMTGAHVSFSVEMPSEEGFAGAITSLDARHWRGQEVMLSGNITVSEGSGAAALWLRADGNDGPLVFRNTGYMPVKRADGEQSRAVRIEVPQAATAIKLGATLQGVGDVSISSLRLTGAREVDTDVSAYAVLEAAMDAMEAQALGAARIDWPAERTRLLTPGLRTAPSREAHAPIEALLRQLDDRHSTLQPARDAADYRARATPAHTIQVSTREGVGYVSVPGLSGTDREQGDAFSAELCQGIEQHAGDATHGWVVDLRQNGGGNMWPMLSGLRALLGDAPPGAFVDRSGVPSPWRIRKVEGCDMDLSGAPVAVLIGPKTASSGEAVAVAFRARPSTHFFGLPTKGLATSNRSIKLPDGAMLHLTTAVFAGPEGGTYPSGIRPDIRGEDHEAAHDAAEAWLRVGRYPNPPSRD